MRYNEGGALLDTENVLGGGVRQIYDYNSAGRVKKFYDSTGTIFADGITYHPHGAMEKNRVQWTNARWLARMMLRPGIVTARA